MSSEVEHTADLIDRFLAGVSEPWEWDDFLAIASNDPAVEEARLRCAGLPDQYPRLNPASYCGPEGLTRLKEIANALRHGQSVRE